MVFVHPPGTSQPAAAAPPVLLLGGSANALSAARSLAAQGVRVDAVGDGLGSSPVRRSRAIGSWEEPHGPDVQQAWFDALVRRAPSAIIPCCDDGVELIATRRTELQELGHLVPPGDDAVLLAMLDKAQTALYAEKSGVATAKVSTVSTIEELLDAAIDIGYPCGLKPVHSHRFTRTSGGVKGATIHDEASLLSIGTRMLDQGQELIVTEIIPGADPVFCSYNTYIDDDGALLFEITKQKLRQHPIDFGLGTFHRTIELPEVADLGQRFLRAAGMRGFGNVEFRRDARDGELKLIECNVRLTAANELLTRAGCDVAGVVYRRTVGWPVSPVSGFREGLAMWHPLRDARAARDYRRAGELTWRDWAKQLVPPPGLPLLSLRDPAPSASVAAGKLRRALSRASARRST